MDELSIGEKLKQCGKPDSTRIFHYVFNEESDVSHFCWNNEIDLVQNSKKLYKEIGAARKRSRKIHPNVTMFVKNGCEKNTDEQFNI